MQKEEFIKKMAEAIEIEDVESLSIDTKFRDLEEWSSLSVMLLIAFFDDEFGKEIGDAELRLCNTIGDLYNLIKE